MAKMLDAIIGGGGMVGLTLGIALAKGGFKVAIADPVPPIDALTAGFDGRVSALTAASVRLLKSLGVWDHLAPEAQIIEDILVTDARLGRAPSPFSLHFDAREHSAPLGFIAENRHIRQALLKTAAEVSTLSLIAPAALTKLAPDAGAVTAHLADGSSLRAAVAIAADGRDSPLRSQMGIGVTGWAYPQWGIVATVTHERPHQGVAHEQFLPSGPFAILPMTGNRCSLVWTESETLAPGMMKLTKAEFDAEVAKRFGAHLGRIETGSLRWSYPLRFHLARALVGPRFALAGDAAHGIHPIAGQGLNLGLKDVAALAEVLLDAGRIGLDPGSAGVLGDYQRMRRFDNFATAMTMDALNRLFSNDIAPLRLVRDIGLGLVDQAGIARRFLIRAASGEM